MRPLVHPQFLARLRPVIFVHRCTIQQASTTQNEIGEPVETWADLPGHVDLPCRVAPLSMDERAELQLTVTQRTITVLLAGSYPSVTTAHRALVDGTAYNILAAERDSEGVTTRLIAEVVET